MPPIKDAESASGAEEEQAKPISRLELFLPLSLSAAVIILDQLTKWLVIRTIPAWSIGFDFLGGIVRIIHVYNTGAAFSLGSNMNSSLRGVVLGLLPVIVILVILRVYFKSRDFTHLQRWCIAGIVGGGIGNLIDRFFRPEGVVDFIDVRVYGFLGFERWPTFNVADSAIVICGIILIASFIKAFIKDARARRKG